MSDTNNIGRGAASYGHSGAAICRAALFSVFALAGLFLGTPAQAVYPMTDTEWAILPKYCHHQSNVSDKHRATPSPQWESYLGSDFPHIHHWCAVYMWMGRVFRAGASSNEGKFNLGRAEADTLYFLERARPDSPIAGEAYTRLGEIYILQGKPRQAEAAFKRAHEVEPARWQPYLLWGMFLYRNGRVADARKEISMGLEHAPNNKALKSFLAEMDAGKKAVQK